MDLISQRINSCKHLLQQNPTFLKAQSQHKSCVKCFMCLGNSFNVESELASKSGIKDILEILTLSHSDNSQTNSILSMILEKTTKCKCSEYEGFRGDRLQDLIINDSLDRASLPYLISSQNAKSNQPHCPSQSCTIRNSKTRCRLVSDPQVYFVNITWANKTLQCLLRFLLSITQTLDLQTIYKKSKSAVKHLQGLILEGYNTVTYVSIDPCVIYHSSGTKENIFLKSLPYLILQYSLYPVVLVYDDQPVEGWDQILTECMQELPIYASFLCGKNILQSASLCYYCWNLSHDECLTERYDWQWECRKCQQVNPDYAIFCIQCMAGRKKSQPERMDHCNICMNPTEFTYCQTCSVIASCRICKVNILKTQPFGCPRCGNWLSSLHCINCKTNLSSKEAVCWRCKQDSANIDHVCKHNSEKSICELCLFEFSCGVCHRSRLAFESKFCWKCRGELIDGMCGTCEKILPTNSLVCSDCKNLSKACKDGHIITQQSKAHCKSCAVESAKYCERCSRFPGNCCSNRFFCKNCDKEITNASENKCYKCKRGVQNSRCEECRTEAICIDCFDVLDSCFCGSKLLNSFKSCANCNKSVLPPPLTLPRYVSLPHRDWVCTICNFSNPISSLFCENCNLNISHNLITNTQCKICGCKTTSKLCEKCFAVANCSTCRKTILAGQGQYCCNCGNVLLDRVCKNCKCFATKSDVVCYLCAKMLWQCQCGVMNRSGDGICRNCGGRKISCCQSCNNQYFDDGVCWRCGIECGCGGSDIFYCLECRRGFGMCSCGARVIPQDCFCKKCERDLRDQRSG